MDISFKEHADELYDEIDRIASTGMSVDEAKKIAVCLIDVLAEHHLTYDQAHKIIEIAHKTLNVKSLALSL